MKIAILTPTFSHFSGIDRLVEQKTKELVEHGHTVDIFALSASIKPKKAGLHIMGMPKTPFFQRLYRLLMFLDIKKIKKYSSILKNYDLIISHLYPMNILACSAKRKNKKLKYIYHNAGVGITDEYSLFEKLYLKIFNFLTNSTIRNADEVISISNFLRQELKKETGIDSKVEYVHVDKKRFHNKIDSKKIRKRYNIKNEPVLLYVGRISPHKGIHLLIESFKIVQKEYPKSKLIIAGKHTFPNYTKKLKKLSNKNVIFTGFIDDKELPYYYAACDIYTTASLWEGFDIPVVESNLTGKPAVAFDVGSHKEVLKKGILVKANDTKAFAETIIELLRKKP
ncbi:MAG: glycosyltransferase family 4 protein [Nanoarchaeota archaeon]|nr:glycosyltransferase family 4 protein [Nanoarchaeota archaeon]MBU1005606.1 glycosyltransferase family 4 protein [Nanoarchaeota archaeon]MBU1945992.1 glycosyltransferase family 4 protein [Nanoarchaeota archaeon]